MSNEPLGIYEELRDRADRYSEAARIRRRNAYPPTVNNGAQAQPANPFMRILRNRIRAAGPPNALRQRGKLCRFRAVWPEADLGISIDAVIKTVIDQSGIRSDEMFSIHQTNRIAKPRQVAMYMIDRYCPDYSLPQIGFIFGKDHTTIIHGIEAVRGRLLAGDAFTVDLTHRVHKALRAFLD